QAETYRVTKQLCADTNLPEFRRLLNGFVRQVVVPKGKLRQPVAVQRYMNVRIMLPSTPELYFPLHTGLLYGHGIASRSLWMPAGYFHLIPDTEEEEERLAKLPPRELQYNNGKQHIFYVANNTSATFCIPVHLQRYMLVDYAEKKKITRDYELFDLEDMLHCP